MDRIGAAVWATGHAGRVIVEAGLTRPWLEFRGGIVYSAAKEGLDLGEACGLDVRIGAPVSTDVDAILARPDIDVVFYAGIGTPAEVAAACLRANRAGKDAITIAGLVHPRTILGTRGRRRAGRRRSRRWPSDPGHGLLGLPDDHPPARLHVERPGIRRDPPGARRGHDVVGPRDPARRGDRRSGRVRRRRLHDAQLPGRGAHAARRVVPAWSSTSRSSRASPCCPDVRRERAGFVVEPGTICGHDRRVTATVRGGGRLVSLWRGRFDLQPDRDGMEGSARVVVEGDPAFETIVRGDIFLDTYPPTGARAMAAVRPLMALPPGLHTIDELGHAAGLPLTRPRDASPRSPRPRWSARVRPAPRRTPAGRRRPRAGGRRPARRARPCRRRSPRRCR